MPTLPSTKVTLIHTHPTQGHFLKEVKPSAKHLANTVIEGHDTPLMESQRYYYWDESKNKVRYKDFKGLPNAYLYAQVPGHPEYYYGIGIVDTNPPEEGIDTFTGEDLLKQFEAVDQETFDIIIRDGVPLT